VCFGCGIAFVGGRCCGAPPAPSLPGEERTLGLVLLVGGLENVIRILPVLERVFVGDAIRAILKEGLVAGVHRKTAC
jgi:hypothetical protein